MHPQPRSPLSSSVSPSSQTHSGGIRRRTLKFTVIAALVGYLIYRGFLDLHALKAALLNPVALALNFGTSIAVTFLVSQRWRLLLWTQAITSSVPRLFRLQVLGGFFSLVGAGTAGSEIYKSLSLFSEYPNQKTSVLMCMFLDRSLVLASLVLICTGAILWIGDTHHLGIVLGLSAVVGLLATAFFFSPLTRFHLWIDSHDGRSWIVRGVRALLAAVGLARQHSGVVLGCLLLAAISMLLTVALYILQARLLGVGLPWIFYPVIVPLTLLASYLSFLPLGLGAGQVVIYQLFVWFGSDQPERAVILSSVVQTYSLAFHLIGGLLSLRIENNRKKRQSSAKGNL